MKIFQIKYTRLSLSYWRISISHQTQNYHPIHLNVLAFLEFTIITIRNNVSRIKSVTKIHLIEIEVTTNDIMKHIVKSMLSYSYICVFYTLFIDLFITAHLLSAIFFSDIIVMCLMSFFSVRRSLYIKWRRL